LNSLILISGAVIALSFFMHKLPKGRLKYNFISPVTLLSVFVILYTVVGFELFWKGVYAFLGNDFSADINKLYDVISVFIVIFFILFYFFLKLHKKRSLSYDYQPKSFYVYSFSFLIACYAILSMNGFGIPILHNFIMLFYNAAIIVVSYAFVIRMRGSSLLILLFTLLIAYMGFRYRLVFLFIPILFSLFIFYRMSFSKFSKYLIFTFLSVFSVALVGVTRKYSSGLQLEKLNGIDLGGVFIKGIFNDTSTVMTSGGLINWLDDTEKFAYFHQINYVFNFFIPKGLYPEKIYSPIFSYISSINGQEGNESGAAVLGFAEYYHTAGYYGVTLFAFIFSLWFSLQFKKVIYSRSRYEHFVYFILMAWFLNSLTRGYFPQNVQDLISIFIGLYLIKKFSKRTKIGVI
jgi:hypothetical protein